MPEAGVETHFRSPELIGHCYGTDLELLADLPPDLYKAFSSFRAPQIVHDVFTVQYQGRALDFVTLCAARIILGILHLLDRDLPKTVCDIGGGTGKFALSWLTNSAHRPDLVVIIDLPETLVYSETLLRTELGDSRVQYVTSPTSRLSRSGAILCPIANVSALKDISFDLITNLFSMQEMKDNWIDCYMQWLDQQPCRFFYSENYFAGPIVNMIEGHNSWSPRPSPEWLLIDAKFGFGTRPWAKMLYQKQDNGRSWMPRPSARGAEAWLGALELARRQLDEASLRSATEFAQAQMPFVPKEAWQVAKMLAEITDSECDRQSFREIDLLRRSGNEAVH